MYAPMWILMDCGKVQEKLRAWLDRRSFSIVDTYRLLTDFEPAAREFEIAGYENLC
jgi:hypothetical protein